MSFVNLYTTTEYSMLYSPMHLHKLIQKAKQYNYKALAITDINNMYGAIKFYDACVENNIKPVIGLYISADLGMDKKSNILLYAANDLGYRNLLKISSRANMNHLVLDYEFLKQNSYGLIAVLPSDESEVVTYFLDGFINEAKNRLNYYKEIYSSLYIGLDMQTFSLKEKINDLYYFSKQNDVKAVALNKSCYLEKEDYDAYQALRSTAQNGKLYELTEKDMDLSFLSVSDLENKFASFPELIKNTEEIANSCHISIGEKAYRKYHMPVFFGDVKDTKEYLQDLCKVGLNKRLKGKNVDVVKYKKRLLYELSIIETMGFCDYFLIVYDYVLYAKKNHILVGPGRGSAPGSLVSYSLGITDIDPIEYDLLFERFLNPERISMPDIDLDFPDNRRDEIIRYVGEKYGKTKVAHISTFGTFGPKMAIRDISKVLKISENYTETVLRYIGNQSIDDAVRENNELVMLINQNKDIYTLLKIARKFEGLPRHTSTHAAGIIMSDNDLVMYTPLQEGMNNLYQTQYEASDLEKLGLVKMDFLGLRNLSIIDDVLKKIYNSTSEIIQLNKIPLDDEETYELIARGDTDGIFQFESKGMRSVLMKLKTSSFIDLVSANALYRPGPMEMIPSFINRKFGKEKIEYIHSDLKEILESTYGIIVFQEQIMLIARKFAGYSLGESDVLRRAVSKKKEEALINERSKFVTNAIKNGYTKEVADEIYDYIVKFANYGFNKPHSVSYSLIAYQMAYLKKHYYKFFMAILMSSSIGSLNLIHSYINDLKKNNIKVLLPSINYSSGDFEVGKDGIYYALSGIQGLGLLTINSLLEERKLNGLYKDYENFTIRTEKILNKRLVQSLIAAGALDEFSLSRKQMMEEYENILNRNKFGRFIDGELIKITPSETEFTYDEISRLEKEALGFNMKYNLFSLHQKLKEKYKTVDLALIEKVGRVNVLCIIRRIREIRTKKGDLMAFLEVYDDTLNLDGVMFPEPYKIYKKDLIAGELYVGLASVEIRDGKKQLIFSKIALVK